MYHLPLRSTPLAPCLLVSVHPLQTPSHPVAFLNLSSYSTGTVTPFLIFIPLEGHEVCIFLLSRPGSWMQQAHRMTE